MAKRQTITLYDYKNRTCKVLISKENFWFSKKMRESRGSLHCVISCNNEASIVYITDYGFARIAYCNSHAIWRILNTIITGQLERGLWCETENGKLKPHYYYKQYMQYMKKLHPKQAKKLELKLKGLKYKK